MHVLYLTDSDRVARRNGPPEVSGDRATCARFRAENGLKVDCQPLFLRDATC
jgi:hypothetical protein